MRRSINTTHSRPALNTTLAAFGLVYPVRLSRYDRKKTQGRCLCIIRGVRAIAAEIGSRNLEDNLNVAGYNSVDEAMQTQLIFLLAILQNRYRQLAEGR